MKGSLATSLELRVILARGGHADQGPGLWKPRVPLPARGEAARGSSSPSWGTGWWEADSLKSCGALICSLQNKRFLWFLFFLTEWMS